MIQIDFCSIIYDLNYIWNLKLIQWRKLCKIFKSSRMQSLNIFGVGERFLFEFSSLSGVSKFENYLTRPGPHVSGLFSFDRLEQSPSPTRRPCSRWPRSPREERSVPVVTGRRCPRGLPPPPYHCSGCHRGSRHPLHFSPPTIQLRSSLLCSNRAAASSAIARH
jgi:hypothetical protein